MKVISAPNNNFILDYNRHLNQTKIISNWHNFL